MSKLIDCTKRISDEDLAAWNRRNSDHDLRDQLGIDVKSIGFPYLQLKIDNMFARTFGDELARISAQLGGYGIKVHFMITNHRDITFGQHGWILFENDAEAIQAKLMLNIHPDHLV